VHVYFLDLFIGSLYPTIELAQGELGGLVGVVETFEVGSQSTRSIRRVSSRDESESVMCRLL
jgi:hypothetical protein